MFETVLLAFILAKIRGNKLVPALKSVWIYPIFVFDMFTIWLQAQIFLHNPDFIPFGTIIKTFYMILYVIPIIRYRLYWPGIIGSGLIFAGTLANKFVMHYNGGKMPVYPTLSHITGYFENGINVNSPDAIHTLGNSATHFKILTDYIDLGYSIISLGDVLIRVFVVIIIFYTIKAVQPQDKLTIRSEKNV